MKENAVRRIAKLPVMLSALIVMVFCWTTPATAQQELTYDDLVRQMLDLERLATRPAEGETCAQWSSYDRSSQYDAETGKYVNWGANNDGPNFIRKEGDQYVMAEMEGPGCIWRIWSARALEGHVKIFIDGQEQPAVDMPFAHYFDGEHAPFNYPKMSYSLDDVGSRGHNLYFPIPYQKSCKVVAEEGWGRYFQFVYTTFPKGTEVPSFSAELAKQSSTTLAEVNAFLSEKLGTDPAGPRQGELKVDKEISVPPGKAVIAAEFDGARAITVIRANADFADRDTEIEALRKLTIRITFDGQKQPAVWAPLGDFFGTAPGENHYKTLVTGMSEGGWYALWYMPFAESAKVELVNDDDTAHAVGLQVVHAPLDRPFSELGHFHCKWHRDAFELPDDREPDWVMLRTEGRGRFCGVMLHVWNPRGGWWGEGDEKFFVDGEKFPSTIGTGSEDYFGYAWCDPDLFQRPFHAQSMTQGNAGHQSVLRWHVADNVPFQKSFEAAIEKYYPNSRALYAATVCWYLAPGGNDPFEPQPVESRIGYCKDLPLVAGGLEVLGRPPGNVVTQKLQHFSGGKWKDDDHLWWTSAKPGDQLEIALPIPAAGKYRVAVVLTKARDYGIVQFAVNGQKAGDPIDLYYPSVVKTEPIDLGVFELDKGKQKLSVKIVGANDEALKRYMFGIDTIKLQPVH